MTAAAYFDAVLELLKTLSVTQRDAIEEAGRLCAEAVKSGGLIHIFGTGHSHILAEEMYARAGGLTPVNAILASDLMLHEGGLRSSDLERLSGMAAAILEHEPVRAGDVMIVASNSGRNAAPVEMAELARERGLKVVAITSLQHAKASTSRAPDGKRLFEVADVVIDNGGLPGDAILPMPGGPPGARMAATSTVIGAAIVQAITAETVARLAAEGIEPPVLISANVDGSRDYNQRQLRRLGSHAPSLLSRELSE